MAKPNKMGMSDAALRRSRAARFPKSLDDNDARQRSPELYRIMDAVQSGEMTPEEGARAVEALNARGGE